MCAWCGKLFETVACLEEHDRGVHEYNNMVCAKGAHGVENILRSGVACRSMAKVNMWAVALDVQGEENCFRNQNTYRNILHKNMNGHK